MKVAEQPAEVRVADTQAGFEFLGQKNQAVLEKPARYVLLAVDPAGIGADFDIRQRLERVIIEQIDF